MKERPYAHPNLRRRQTSAYPDRRTAIISAAEGGGPGDPVAAAGQALCAECGLRHERAALRKNRVKQSAREDDFPLPIHL